MTSGDPCGGGWRLDEQGGGDHAAAHERRCTCIGVRMHRYPCIGAYAHMYLCMCAPMLTHLRTCIPMHVHPCMCAPHECRRLARIRAAGTHACTCACTCLCLCMSAGFWLAYELRLGPIKGGGYSNVFVRTSLTVPELPTAPLTVPPTAPATVPATAGGPLTKPDNASWPIRYRTASEPAQRFVTRFCQEFACSSGCTTHYYCPRLPRALAAPTNNKRSAPPAFGVNRPSGRLATPTKRDYRHRSLY